MNKDFIKKINTIQTKLNCTKSQYNKFGNYAYRNAEDILEAIKPLLQETGLVLTCSDSLELVADRMYIKATVTLTDGEDSLSNTAYAREPLEKKGFDEMQVTGATSSYARKYALNGLLCIDDNKDADNFDNSAPKTETKAKVAQPKAAAETPKVNADLSTRVKNQIFYLSGLQDNSISKEKGIEFFKAARNLCKDLQEAKMEKEFKQICELVKQKSISETETKENK